jgi:two-component system, LuxR family, sensor kinase FixL
MQSASGNHTRLLPTGLSGFVAGVLLILIAATVAIVSSFRLLAEQQPAASVWLWWLVASSAAGCALGVLLIALAAVYARRTHRAVLDAAGKPQGLIDLDTTGRKQAEEELAQSRQRLVGIVESAMDAIVTVDDQQRIVLFNRAAETMFRCPAEQALGSPVDRFIPQQFRQAHRDHIHRFGETGQTTRAMGHLNPLSGVRADGDEFPIEASISQVQVGESKLFTVILRDITERKRVEAEIVLRAQELGRVNESLLASERQLQAANRELDDFATIVSHDLKAPLRGVATLAKWIETDYADKLDAEGRENLAEMVKRVARMDRMIEGILHYSRLGRTEEKPEPVALDELVADVVQDLAPAAHVRVHVTPGLPVVYGEPVRLRQVFQNLIGNAIKYGDKAETDIRVEIADGGLFWQFSVVDNGPGIEERHFERIFKIFQTLAPKDKTDSTGVGLALVKRIVERAGGRVWVKSRPGEGSTFHFTWPNGSRVLPDKNATKAAGGVGPPAPEPNLPAAELQPTGRP